MVSVSISRQRLPTIQRGTVRSGPVTARSETGLGTGWRRGLAKFRVRADDSVFAMLSAAAGPGDGGPTEQFPISPVTACVIGERPTACSPLGEKRVVI